MAATGDSVGLGIDEDTAAVVVPGRPTQLIGRSGAVLIHRSAKTRVGGLSPLAVDDVCLSLLGAGDSLDLQTGVPYPSIDKLHGMLLASRVAAPASTDRPGRDPGLRQNALADGGLLKLAIMAATDLKGESVGVVSGSRPTNLPHTAFELRLVS